MIASRGGWALPLVFGPASTRSAGELDAGFNVPVRAKKEGQWDVYRSRLKVLHFANALKPWSAEHHHDWLFDKELKRLWDDAYRFVPVRQGLGR
jgi:hypothetical protein